jgi:hypothetical protein
MIHMSFEPMDPFNDLCPFCLGELARGVPEDGKCGHEPLLEKYPHLRFNAWERLDPAVLADSAARFQTAYDEAINNA